MVIEKHPKAKWMTIVKFRAGNEEECIPSPNKYILFLVRSSSINIYIFWAAFWTDVGVIWQSLV